MSTQESLYRVDILTTDQIVTMMEELRQYFTSNIDEYRHGNKDFLDSCRYYRDLSCEWFERTNNASA